MPSALRFAALIAAVVPLLAQAQAQPAYGCDSLESKRFDFWVGDWELEFAGGKGGNRIEKTLDGCVIVEHFRGAPGTKLDGTSVSTFDRVTNRWRQAWVDNTGTYLDFVGGEDGGDPTFERAYEKDGKTIRLRMVFREVTKDSLKWLWQRSDDAGKSWKTAWEIDYRRAK